MISERVRTRFAPSPTGYLHIGGLRTALYAYLFAKNNGGDFILRIEDTDLERYVPGAVEIICSTLRDSGLEYDEGGEKGGPYGPYVQSERRAIYAEYAKKLVELGGAYYCFCTKERLESLADENGQRKYDKHCLYLSPEEVQRRLDAGEPYVIRQNIPDTGTSSYEDLVFGKITVDFKDLDDNILLKSDGMPTYNFANVIDDHLMKINYVIRGTEYLSSTPKYNLIYDAFGWERPQYIHLPPVMRDAQHKLSKRYGDPSYNDLIKEGFLKEALVNYLALLGWSPKDNREKMSFEELRASFSLSGLNRSPAIFDKAKLRWLNGEYLKEMDEDRFNALAAPWYDRSKAAGKYDYRKLSALLKTRVETFAEIPEKINFLEEYGDFDLALFEKPKLKATRELAGELLPKLTAVCEAIPDAEWNNGTLHEALMNFVGANGLKNGQVLWPFRIAITGRENTPGGATEMADLLGKARTVERLKAASARL